jgi:hypothetical protein
MFKSTTINWRTTTTLDWSSSIRCVKPFGSRSFTLKGMLIWTIHIFLEYGIVARVAHQGFTACSICGPKFKGEHSIKLRKQTYIGTHRWLLKGHPYRIAKMKNHFNGQLKHILNQKMSRQMSNWHKLQNTNLGWN